MTRVLHPMACAVKQRLQVIVSRQTLTENATVEQTKTVRKTSSLFLFLSIFPLPSSSPSIASVRFTSAYPSMLAEAHDNSRT